MSAEAERTMMRRIVALESENTDLMSELNRLWAELDKRRLALERLTSYPDGQVAETARAGLA